MKKYILLGFLISFLLYTPVKASLTSYYAEIGLNLPSVEARNPLAEDCGILDYKGTRIQNITLEKCLRGELLGSSITTINASDLMRDSRTVINDNFASLNAGKIENSTTSIASVTTLANLSSIGTIGTGVWNGTPITVPYGGTGSTTLSSNQVLLGNGTGIVKTVSGLGNNGEFLTSGGAGVPPTWASATVNQTAAYNWTGLHSFSNVTTMATTTMTSSTINNLNVPSTSTSTLPHIYVDQLGNGATTTVVNNLQVNGSINYSGTRYGSSQVCVGNGTFNTSETDTFTCGFQPSLITVTGHYVWGANGVAPTSAFTSGNYDCTTMNYAGSNYNAGNFPTASGGTGKVMYVSDPSGSNSVVASCSATGFALINTEVDTAPTLYYTVQAFK